MSNAKVANNAVNASKIATNAVTAGKIAGNAVTSGKVADNSLTGLDIKDQSGVDTCVLSTRVGQLCVRVENFARPWTPAFLHCANLDLRLPTLSEAMELVQTHDRRPSA